VAYEPNINLEETKSFIKEHFSIPAAFYEYSADLSKINLPAQINLLPKELIDKEARIQKRQEILVTYSLIGFIIFLCFAFVFLKSYEKRKILSVFESNASQVKLEAEKIDRFFKKVEFAKMRKEQGKLIVEILKSLYDIAPSNISISGLDYDGKAGISCKGTSKVTQDIFDFTKSLERSKFFYKAEIKYATQKKVKGEEFTDFNIQCEIKK